MVSRGEKKDLILAYETRFAHAVAAAVLDRPKLSVWMILIPIIFVYFVYRYKQYSAGRNQFAEHYLVSRKRALNEAFDALEADRKPNIESVVRMTTSPKEALGAYQRWVALLVQHYQDMLQAGGDSRDALVKSAYKKKANYLLCLNNLRSAEKKFNTALKPHLYQSTEGVNDIVDKMERSSETLSRKNADQIFS